VARIGTGQVNAGVLFGNQRKSDKLEDLKINVRIILKFILKKSLPGLGIDWSGTGYGQMVGLGEGGNDHSRSVKLRNFLTTRRWSKIFFLKKGYF